MKAYFYNFTKRSNSTKQPAANTGAEYNVTLLEGCSIIAPVIKLDLGLVTPPTSNYMYLPEFNRYYWLAGDGWTFANRCWYGNFAVDPLASWKSYIGSSSCYILRAASAYDGDISDMNYPCKATPERSANLVNTGYSTQFSSGCYVVGIITGNTSHSIGAVTYYVMTESEMNSFMDEIINTNLWNNVTDISNALFRSIFNPFQYIVSCNWFPLNAGKLPITETNPHIHFGWWELIATAPILTTAKFSPIMSSGLDHYVIDIPKHPDTASRGSYLNAKPYAEYYLDYMPFGIFDLPNLIEYDQLQIKPIIDAVTGGALLEIRGIKNGSVYAYKLHESSTQFAVPIQLAQSGSNILSGATEGATSLAGTAHAALDVEAGAGALAIAPLAMAATVKSGVEKSSPKIQAIGGNGSAARIGTNILLTAVFHIPVDDNAAEYGRPLFDTRTIGNLSGFIMTNHADPEIPCSKTELDSIISYMNGGFFYE